jgi:hypothetical protein
VQAQSVVSRTAVELSWLSHYPSPRAWSAIGDAHKQGPLPVQEDFALAVLASGWPADTRYGSQMQLRARSLEPTAVVAHALDTRSAGTRCVAEPRNTDILSLTDYADVTLTSDTDAVGIPLSTNKLSLPE